MEKIKYSICVSDLRKKYKEKEVLKSVQITLKRNASSATAELLFHF